MTTAAKEETTSAPRAVLFETRVRGIAPKNANAIGLELSISSTLRWGSWQIYDGTAVERLVGLDYFGARYFSGAQGRFTSPDPKMFPHDITDPQSWNKYGYTRNNPLRYVDQDGQDFDDVVDRIKGYFAALFQPVSSPAEVTSPRVSSNPLNGPGFDESELATGYTQEAGKRLDKLSDIYITVDPTGVGQMAKGAMQGDKSDMAAAAFPLAGIVAGEAFKSFGVLKTALGPAGENMAWHHIVEQSKVGEFGAEAINNGANIVKVTKEVNSGINAYYSSKQAFTGGKTVRQWLSGQSWKQQYQFGVDILKSALNGTLQ